MPRKPQQRQVKPAAAPGTFTVAIVGRPNVGKSTLFNRLTGRRLALVHDRPGVTRDRREGVGDIAGMRFTVFDTAGFEDASAETLEGRMRRMTEQAVDDADVALFLVDGRDGITPLDESFAAVLRKRATPVVLVANKADTKAAADTLLDAYRLGFGEAVAVSAEHGTGLDGLFHALRPFAPEEALADVEVPPPAPEHTDDDNAPARPLQLAIVGRPNVGKSTLVNRLVGQDRLLTGPEPGITRDAIAVPLSWQGRAVRLVDTAGVRKRPRVIDAVEKLSVSETFETIKMAEVVALVVDGTVGLDKQDLTIARHVVDEGRALVVAINKWDVVADRQATQKRIQERLDESLAQAKGVPVVTVSAATGQRCDTLMKAVFDIHAAWSKRIPTAALNRWLEALIAHHPPPLSVHKQRIKIRYMTQTKARPPTFVLFTSRPGDLPEAYMRYLTSGLRETFALDGVPLRLFLRKPKNPFVEK
ncbi:MAG: ribosome biogenesis GTPase Der [Rhodospirillaceae bacterium]|nr:ribosome biogenesis GTPase Der [Rhodospirillaceae bacterium]